VLAVDAALSHAAVQYFEPLLALAAADDLADRRCQRVPTPPSPARGRGLGRGDGAAVVVHPHVEGFDVLRVVHNDDRLLGVFLGQIALMLRLQVDSPVDREREVLLPRSPRPRNGGRFGGAPLNWPYSRSIVQIIRIGRPWWDGECRCKFGCKRSVGARRGRASN
jgi:hypothetical protein